MEISAQKLKAYREQHGLTQAEFADQVGITQGSVSMIEKGRGARPETYRKIHAGTEGELSPNDLLLPERGAA